MGNEKMVTIRGFYAGVMQPDTGKLLLIRRTKTDSIIPGTSFRGNWELPGGAVMASSDPSVSYNYYVRDLTRLLHEKTGILIIIRGLPKMYSVLFKGPNGYDEASVIPLVAAVKPTIGDTTFVSPYELQVLAKEYQQADEAKGISGEGLLSGYGKRMHCMALAALCHSPKQDFIREAVSVLSDITMSWA